MTVPVTDDCGSPTITDRQFTLFFLWEQDVTCRHRRELDRRRHHASECSTGVYAGGIRGGLLNTVRLFIDADVPPTFVPEHTGDWTSIAIA